MRLNAARAPRTRPARRAAPAKAVAVTSIPSAPKKPLMVKVKSCERIVDPKATGETCHIVLDTEGKAPFWEGQSYGVVPPGTKTNSKGKEVPHGVRLYSIASTRYGDYFDGKTASLCVRRATYWDPEP